MKIPRLLRPVTAVLLTAATTLAVTILGPASAASAAENFCAVSYYQSAITIGPGQTRYFNVSPWNPSIQAGTYIQDGLTNPPVLVHFMQQDRGANTVRTGAYNPSSSNVVVRGWSTVMFYC